MSNKAEQYAEALIELSRNKNTEELDILIEHLKGLLKKKHLSSLFQKIAASLYKAEARKKDFVLIRTPKPLTTSELSNILHKHEHEVAKRRVHTEVDETLIGGYQLETTDTRFDYSYKTSLLNLYTTLLKNN